MSQLCAARCNKSILTNLDQLHRFKREVCEVFEVGVAEAHLCRQPPKRPGDEKLIAWILTELRQKRQRI